MRVGGAPCSLPLLQHGMGWNGMGGVVLEQWSPYVCVCVCDGGPLRCDRGGGGAAGMLSSRRSITVIPVTSSAPHRGPAQ